MKNIYLLPTDKPSRVYSKDGNYKLDTITIAMDWYISEGYKPQNIYITSDELIPTKDGEWYIKKIRGCWRVSNYLPHKIKLENDIHFLSDCRKVILTTDQELIKDGVQAIDDEFLEWFVKNPSCEKVEVVVENYKEDEWVDDDFGGEIYTFEYERYKIIIPKEELPKSELKIGDNTNFGIITDINEKSVCFGKNKVGVDVWYKKSYVVKFPNLVLEEPKQETLEEVPTELDSVLAKISHQNDLGLSQWYEVVYYTDGKWCSYSGSKTFQDGERVLEWKYCKDLI